MKDNLNITDNMIRSSKKNIPLFRLAVVNNIRCIDFKFSSRNCHKAEDKRHEHIKVSTFIALLSDENLWNPGSLFYTPKYHLPMFRMLEIGGEHWIEVKNHRNNKTECIYIVSILEVLLDEKMWKAA